MTDDLKALHERIAYELHCVDPKGRNAALLRDCAAALSRPQAAADDERETLKLIDQRDRAEEFADKLAAVIASLLGVEIGEHSSANNPWQTALDAYNEAPAARPQAAEGVRPVAWWNGQRTQLNDREDDTEASFSESEDTNHDIPLFSGYNPQSDPMREIEALKKALWFWLPGVPAEDHPLHKRIADDAYLLMGHGDLEKQDAAAQEASMTPNADPAS